MRSWEALKIEVGRMTGEGRGKMDERMTKKIKTVRDMKVYRKTFDSAMEISLHCKYIDVDTFQRLDDDYEHISTMLNAMEKKADTFCRPSP
jgi:hypothetical protein